MATAPELIIGARVSSRLTQAELARRAGLPRSVLNAYEHGKREPGADGLARILAAAGRELRAGPAPRRLDPQRADRILQQVLELAEALPFRRRRALPPSPFRAVAR